MRLSPRVKANLPVTVNGKVGRLGAILMNLSIEGALIKARLHSVGVEDAISLEYYLPGQGLLKHTGRIVRKNTRGVALTFPNLEPPIKIRLWNYIVDKLQNLSGCPYCGKRYGHTPAVCQNCGWRLDFHSPNYFDYQDKMHLLKSLYSKADTLPTDQIRRLIHFLDLDILKKKFSEDFQEFVGASDPMREVFTRIRKVAPTNMPVLILGESGTGKELTALTIHAKSLRKEKGFVPINCTAIPETLLESELFGYEKGAYTGACSSKMGKFEYADGGTLFLDEIGELSPALQVKLLRFLEDQIIERIGSLRGKKVSVRLIAATSRNLQSAISEGKFRPDLYYRLEAFTINLPPVRERGEDGVLLAKYFLARFSGEMGVSKNFTEEAEKAITNYSWPGNVREIIHKVKRSMIMSTGDLIGPKDLGLDVQEATGARGGRPGRYRGKIDAKRAGEVLQECDHNISKAAKVLGISRPTLYKLKKKFGI